MEDSTSAVTLGVAMKQVESDSRALSAALADGAVRDLSHEELGELAATGRAVQARIDAVILAAVGEVDARGSFATDGALTAAAWLRSTVTVTPAEAAGAVRTARALRGGLLPGTVAALVAGEITARHAQVIADGIHTTSSGGHRGPAPAQAVALIEPEVLAVARAADTRAVGSVMAAFQQALDPDAADAAALRRWERRGLTLAPARGRHQRDQRAGRRVLGGGAARGDRRRVTAGRRGHPHPGPDPPRRPGRDLPAVPGEPRRPCAGRRRAPPRHRHHRRPDPLPADQPGDTGRWVAGGAAGRDRPDPGLHRAAAGL